MKNIKFRQQHIEFISKNIKDSGILNKINEAIETQKTSTKNHFTKQLSLPFSEKEQETLINELTFLLTSIGLDKEGSINQQGSTIEDIIDLFFTE